MVYRKLPDLPHTPATVVRDLRAVRERMRKIMDGVKPHGPAYLAAAAIMTAVDAFATLLTGDPKYFHAEFGGISGGTGPLGSLQDKLAREKGEQPWKRI